GWSPIGEEEIFTKGEIIEILDADRLSTSAAIFDSKKLQWMNNQYIKKLNEEEVIDLAMPHLIESGKLPEEMTEEMKEWAINLIKLYKDQLSYGAEIVELTELFFQTNISYNEEAKAVLADEH